MHLRKILNRATSALLAGVMSLSAIPTNAFASSSKQETYASTVSGGLTDAITGSSGSVSGTVDVIKDNTTVKLQSAKSSQVGSWPATYNIAGISGYAYCADHSKGAPTGSALNIEVTSMSEQWNAMLKNIFFAGATDDSSRGVDYAKSYLWDKLLDIWPNRNNYCSDSDMQGLTIGEWRKATQLALWSALSKSDGQPYMYLENQEIYSDGSCMIEPSLAGKAYDTLYTNWGHSNMQSAEGRRIIALALGLRVYASWLIDTGAGLDLRDAKGVGRYTEQRNLEKYAVDDTILDFTSSGQDGKGGNIQTAYDQITNGGTDDESGIYIKSYNGKDYYTIYYTFISKTQPKPNSPTTVSLSGNYPAGTILSPLKEGTGKNGDTDTFANVWGLDAATYPDIYNQPATPGTSIKLWNYSQIPSGTGDIYQGDISPGLNAFVNYFKVMIPVDSVTPDTSADFTINMSNDNVYVYRLFLSNNANGKYQPFLLGDTTAKIATDAKIVWGERELGYYFNVYKKDATTGKMLEGAEFTATNKQTGTKLGPIKTDATGTARFEFEEKDLKKDGQYTVWEIKETSAPSGYKPVSETFTITSGETMKGITVENTPTTIIANNTSSPIKKVDAVTGMPLGGATFRLTGNTDDNSSVRKEVTTDGQGTLPIQWWDKSSPDTYIKPGSYTVTEIAPPEGYNLSTEGSKVIQLYYDEVTGDAWHSGNLIFRNAPKPYVEIIKFDENGNYLDGVSFKVFKDGVQIDTAGPTAGGVPFKYYGPDGTGLENGFYEFQEITAPEGYLLNTEKKGVNVDVDSDNAVVRFGAVELTNVKTPTILIKKISENDGGLLAGAVFDVYIDEQKIGSYTTGDNGQINITEAEYGKFLAEGRDSWTVKVVETSPPPGYLLPENPVWETELKKGQELLEISLTNSKYPEIEIIKTDKETGKPLAGASFDIYIENQKLVGGPFTTDDTGTIRLTYDHYGRFLGDLTNPDKKWQIRVEEVSAPENYNKDEVKGGGWTQNATFKLGTTLVKFEYADTSYRDIQVTKKDADNGWLLGGAVYKLHCVSLAADANTTQKPADRTATTASGTGIALFENVPNGTYQITEVTPPEGYQGTTRVETVVVSSSSENVIDVEYENEPLTGLVIRKVDSVTKQPLANAKFIISGHLNDGSTFGPTEYYADANGLITIERVF